MDKIIPFREQTAKLQQELKEILKGRTLGLIDTGMYLGQWQDIFLQVHEAKDLIITYTPDPDISGWIASNYIEACFIHAHTVKELFEVYELHNKNVPIGVFIRGIDGAFADSHKFFEACKVLQDEGVVVMNKPESVDNLVNAFEILLVPEKRDNVYILLP